jgi:hypothetical protein
MSTIKSGLQLQRFNTVPEKRTQIEVEQFLQTEGYTYEREKRLSERDIPDFFIHSSFGNVVLEVKTRYAKKATYRQLERYSKYDEVNGLILLTGTSMCLPLSINNKPSLKASLGVGWL